MTTLTFDFNVNEMEKIGYDIDEYMKPIRNYMSEKNIVEIYPFTFARDDNSIVCDFMIIIFDLFDKDDNFIHIMNRLILNTNNIEIEDCIIELKKIYEKERKSIA